MLRRQYYRKYHSLSGITLRHKRSAHLRGYLVSNREPKASSMFFRCEERIEQPVDMCRSNPMAMIDDLDRDFPIISRRG